MRNRPVVRILGTHGVPASYGGFETAAEQVGIYLRDRGWRVVVYCQRSGTGPITTDDWNGLERVNIPIEREGWLGTSLFDLVSVRHAARHRDVCLTFGYNTAIFNTLQRVKGIPNVINMDGIEWSRARWGRFRQAILWVNERLACFVGNELIADHPAIETYLRTRARASKITTIAYGAHAVTASSAAIVNDLGLAPGKYLTVICRPIPENSILELVRGFSARRRGVQLVLLGNYVPDDGYHCAVRAAASDEVVFLGAIYDPSVVSALRYHCRLYLHGHTVGGTNPSLVEAMAAGNPVLAHDNVYNRWVAGGAAQYFANAREVDQELTSLLSNGARLAEMSSVARARHAEEFTWEHIASQYEILLRKAASKL